MKTITLPDSTTANVEMSEDLVNELKDTLGIDTEAEIIAALINVKAMENKDAN